MKRSKGKGRAQKGNFNDREGYGRNSRGARDKVEGNSPKDNPWNDFSWYNNNPLLLQATARLPFPYRPGMDLNLITSYVEAGKAPTQTNTPVAIPGIMRVNYSLSVGETDNVTSPASLVAKEMYARIRRSFSGSLSVDAPDLFMYIMAIDSIYNQIAEMKRVARVINTFSPDNYLIPETLLKALCPTVPDTEELLQDKVKLFGYINELVGMVNKFYAPGDMSVFNRHYWMGDNVYTDDVMLNSQWYVFVNKYHYEIGISGQYTNLTPVQFTYSETPVVRHQDNSYVSQWYYHVRGMIEALSNSEDAYTINGYFERAYEGIPSFKMAPFTLDEQFMPVYEEEVLAQIENMLVLDLDPATLKVTQQASTNAILCHPTTKTLTGGSYTTNRETSLLSIRSNEPDVIHVVEASRLHPGIRREMSRDNIATGKFIIYPATEIVSSLDILVRSGTIANLVPNAGTLLMNSGGITGDLFVYWLWVFSTISQFDWAPIFTIYDTTTRASWILGDIHNVTIVPLQQYENINRVCLFSLFNAFSQQ